MPADDNPPSNPDAKTQIDSNAKTKIAGSAGGEECGCTGTQPAPARLAAEALGAGAVLGGRYVIEAQLGQGGMGAVYRARDRTLDEEVALKVLLPSLMEAHGMAERFLQEAKTALRLTHPSIVRVRSFETDATQGLSFIVMVPARDEALLPAPRNKNPEQRMYERTVQLTREKGAWRISQGQ